jgi:pSer/pThr/pTyr-binding forkhead associated (FHA) protein
MFTDERRRTPGAAATCNSSQRARTARCAEGDVRADDLALVVTEGESPGLCVSIGNAPVVIGRGVGVDLQVKDPTVSRHHCVIWRAAGRCWVRDLGSTNQTRVNNRPARITELFDGDVVVVGYTALTLATRVDEAGTADDPDREG